jgi:hypothetical protein
MKVSKKKVTRVKERPGRDDKAEKKRKKKMKWTRWGSGPMPKSV